METRILTLFDDEDFLPKPEPEKKTKAKKEDFKDIKEDVDTAESTVQSVSPLVSFEAPQIQDNTNDVSVSITEHDFAPELVEDQPTLPEQELSTNIPSIEEDMIAIDAVDKTNQSHNEPLLDHSPAEQNIEPDIQAQLQTTSDAINDFALNIEPDADALNKQIVSELILSDYTAFLQHEANIPITKPAPFKESELTEEEPTIDTQEPAAEPLPDWDLDKKYYSIGEVAQMFQVNNSHIRFWTNEFKLKPRTTRKGDRLYSPEIIGELRLIHDLVKIKKHTIKGAREKLKAQKEIVHQNLDLKDTLIGLKEMLVNIKDQL